MTSDANKGITSITYNHLNLPEQLNFSSGGVINYVYDGTGAKLEKTASNGAYTEYAGNHIYEGGTLQFFSHPEGYVDVDNGNYSYVYRFKDHLENIRLSYTDADGNGTIDPATEIIKETNYYPYGLSHRGYNGNISPLGNSVAKRFMFGGKEFQEELNLDWYDITARNYDPALGRWMNLDPLAEQMRRHSPYNYAFDNPIYFIDYDGMMPCPKGEDCSSRWGIFKMEFKETLKSMGNGLKSMNNDIKSALGYLPPIDITGDAPRTRGNRTSKDGGIDFRSKNGQGEGDTTDGAVDAHVNADDILDVAPGSPNGNKTGRLGDGRTRSFTQKKNMASTTKEISTSGKKAKRGIEKGSSAVGGPSTIMSGNANEPDSVMVTATQESNDRVITFQTNGVSSSGGSIDMQVKVPTNRVDSVNNASAKAKINAKAKTDIILQQKLDSLMGRSN